jgi:hypothetical protein
MVDAAAKDGTSSAVTGVAGEADVVMDTAAGVATAAAEAADDTPTDAAGSQRHRCVPDSQPVETQHKPMTDDEQGTQPAIVTAASGADVDCAGVADAVPGTAATDAGASGSQQPTSCRTQRGWQQQQHNDDQQQNSTP